MEEGGVSEAFQVLLTPDSTTQCTLTPGRVYVCMSPQSLGKQETSVEPAGAPQPSQTSLEAWPSVAVTRRAGLGLHLWQSQDSGARLYKQKKTEPIET